MKMNALGSFAYVCCLWPFLALRDLELDRVSFL